LVVVIAFGDGVAAAAALGVVALAGVDPVAAGGSGLGGVFAATIGSAALGGPEGSWAIAGLGGRSGAAVRFVA
jgi:hypothetical protein